MKKFVVLLLCIVSLFSFCACNKDAKLKEFTDLGDKTLFVGSDNHFVNYQNEISEEIYLDYVVSVDYTLNRTSYASNANSIYIDGYYYYWTKNEVTDQVQLGTCKTTTYVTNSYFTFGVHNENITVKTITKTKKNFDYTSKIMSKDFSYNIRLNGYFSNFTTLNEKSTILANQIDTSGSKTYYIDTTIPNQTRTNIQSFTSTYYYFQ